MSREIRRVDANWEHPRRKCPHNPWAGGCDYAKRSDGKCFQPMFDRDFDTALLNWLEDYKEWKKVGAHEYELWDDIGGPPDPQYYRPAWKSAEWYQLYEGVSEGTPLSPAFATKHELVDWLSTNKDYWGNQWTRNQAEKMIDVGYSPSGVMVGGKMYNSQEAVELP